MVNHQGITFLAEQVGDTNVIADYLEWRQLCQQIFSNYAFCTLIFIR